MHLFFSEHELQAVFKCMTTSFSSGAGKGNWLKKQIGDIRSVFADINRRKVR